MIINVAVSPGEAQPLFWAGPHERALYIPHERRLFDMPVYVYYRMKEAYGTFLAGYYADVVIDAVENDKTLQERFLLCAQVIQRHLHQVLSSLAALALQVETDHPDKKTFVVYLSSDNTSQPVVVMV